MVQLISKREAAGNNGLERVPGPGPRIVNILANNFRGLIGFVVPVLILPWFGRKGEHDITVLLVWFWIFWCFLLQPVNNPVAAFIPVFVFPMTGVMSSKEVCLSYFNEYIVLFIACSWLSLLVNHSELDRRFIIWFLCSRYYKKYKLKSLLIKTSISTYNLSMISNRLLVTSKIMEYTTEVFADKPYFDQVSNVFKNAIQTSSSIGSIGIVHSSYATLAFLALWCSSDHGKSTDVFNYLQYSLFAIPVSLVMFLLNLVYHILLMTRLDKNISEENVKQVRKSLKKYKRSIQKNISFHEKLSFILTSLSLLMFFSRWSRWFGWTYSRNDSYIADAVVATIFVTLIEILPRDLSFTKYFTAKNKSEMPAEEPTLSLVQWKFAEKHTNYGYIYMLGCGVALYKAAKKSGADITIKQYSGKLLSTPPWSASILVVCLASAILANATSGVAALATLLPFVLLSDMEHPHLAALGVGIACSLGFAWPFRYTPAYYCHYGGHGHVPIKIMAKYSIISVLICLIVIWLSLCFWAPVVLASPLTQPSNSTDELAKL